MDPLALRNQLADLISRARFLEVHQKDIDTAFAVTDLFPHLMDLVDEAIEALKALESCSTAGHDPCGAEKNVGPWSRDLAPHHLKEFGDLCFLVCAELKGCRDHVGRISCDSGTFSIFSSIEQVESKLLRGLCTVEAELARLLGLTSVTQHVDLCRGPLQVRRLIGKFRRRVAAADPQDPEQRLRSVAASLAWLRGQDHFSRISASDRLMARDLQERIGAWLGSRERLPDEAGHILEEVSAFIALVGLINRRPELLEHDSALVSLLIEELIEAAPHGPVPGSLAERFHRLLGRDDRLDGLLSRGADTAAVLDRLLRLQEELCGTPLLKPPDEAAAAPDAGALFEGRESPSLSLTEGG